MFTITRNLLGKVLLYNLEGGEDQGRLEALVTATARQRSTSKDNSIQSRIGN